MFTFYSYESIFFTFSVVTGLDDAMLTNDAFDQLGGRDVEGGVIDLDAVGGGLAAEAVGDFGRVAVFDGDAATVGQFEVEGARWGRRRRTEYCERAAARATL